MGVEVSRNEGESFMGSQVGREEPPWWGSSKNYARHCGASQDDVWKVRSEVLELMYLQKEVCFRR